MTIILLIAFSGSGQASEGGGVVVMSPRSGADGTISHMQSSPPSEACASARRAVRFYQRRHAEWKAKTGVATHKPAGLPRCPRNYAKYWRAKAHQARLSYGRWLRWLDSRTLDDFVVKDGNRAWHRAVREVQGPYPGTESWLLSCSASEGGHGRWVPNSQGSGVGGWLQFMPGTWAGFYRHAVNDVAGKGYRVPRSSASWYSPLGQALAGAWGITHGMKHHWAGAGCW